MGKKERYKQDGYESLQYIQQEGQDPPLDPDFSGNIGSSDVSAPPAGNIDVGDPVAYRSAERD